MAFNSNRQAFFALVRAGLWEKDIRLSQDNPIDFKEVYQLSQQQSVVGLIAAGLEHVAGFKLSREEALVIAGEALQLEQRNTAMNHFIESLVDKMGEAGIKALLVKGQGIAQCYEKPLWRACGDVDLFLDEENYHKAKEFLSSLADWHQKELEEEKHQEFTIGPWTVEIHGNMPSRLMPYVDDALNEIQGEAFEKNQTRIWKNEGTEVSLLAPDNDVIFVFTHILKHFFRGGIGLKQVCDLCRLLWTHRNAIDRNLLEARLRRMKLMSEWRAFGALAVEELGMPAEAMPLYSSHAKWRRKAGRIVSLILETGNLGHNRDKSYYSKYPYIIRKLISLWRHSWDGMRQFFIFPMDSTRIWGYMIAEGVRELHKDRNS